MKSLQPVLALIAIFAASPAWGLKDEAPRREQLAQLKSAIDAYELVFEGKKPTRLSELLTENLVSNASSFVRPKAAVPLVPEIDERGDYTLEGLDGASGLVVREKAPLPGERQIFAIFKDGEIKALDAPAPPAAEPPVTKPEATKTPSTPPPDEKKPSTAPPPTKTEPMPPTPGQLSPTQPATADPGGPAATASPPIALVMPNPTAGSPIVIRYDRLPGNARDWIAIAPVGGGERAWKQWLYTEGKPAGEMTFNAIEAGNYELRVYVNDSYQRIATVPFAVAPASVAATPMPTGAGTESGWYQLGVAIGTAIANKNNAQNSPPNYSGPNYNVPSNQLPAMPMLALGPKITTNGVTLSVIVLPTPGQRFSVVYGGMPASSTAWITVTAADHPDSQYGEWHWTNGARDGIQEFQGVPAGRYQVRIFADRSTKVTARLPFEIR